MRREPGIHSALLATECLENIRPIGAGGMAQVYQAYQRSLQRHVAVKRLKDKFLHNEEARERFRREARALGSVLHQNVAHVYDFVEGDQEAFLIMEFIEGLDLSEMIKKMGQLPPKLSAALLLGVARGVSYIHGRRLVHRDVKPANIRITPRGEVKLMDFGIVIELGSHTLTQPGLMVGSPSYLSPEQVLGDPVSPQSDQFALGICLYEMLTGVRPFREGEGQTLYQRIRMGQYVPVRRTQPTVPRELADIVHRCLQVRPEHRYPSVRGLVYALEQYLGPESSAHPQEGILRYLDGEALLRPQVAYGEDAEELGAPRRTPRWLIGLGITILVSLAGAAGFFAGKEAAWRGIEDVQARYAAPRDLPPNAK